MKRLSILVSVLLVIGVLLSACGGAPTDPAGTVQAMMNALQSKQLDQMLSFVCAAQRDKAASQFNPAGSLASGVDPKQALDAVTIALKDATFTKTSETADAAVVHMKGTMTIAFDQAKMTALLKASGQDDASISQSLALAATLFSSGLPLDNDVNLIKENGKWVVCQ